jgi:hypothetical protein
MLRHFILWFVRVVCIFKVTFPAKKASDDTRVHSASASSAKEKTMGHDVAVFQPYPFTVGQKIRIEGGRRGGDWEVIGISETTVTLRCPVSHREFAWNRFCYLVDEEKDAVWPRV